MNSTALLCFFYARPDNTSRLIKRLIDLGARDLFEIYLFVDGCEEHADKELIERNRQVREKVEIFSANSNSTAVYRKSNFGIFRNVIEGVEAVFQSHASVIVLEDDIVPTNFAFDYFKNALAKFENDSLIRGVAGNSFVCESSANDLPDAYLLPIASSWSWATWKHKWYDLKSFKYNELIEKVRQKGVDQFNFGGFPYFKLLNDSLTTKPLNWDILYYANMYLDGGYYLFPKYSLCANEGAGTFASHTSKENSFFPVVKDWDFKPKMPEQLVIDVNVIHQFENCFQDRLESNSIKRKDIFHRIISKLKLK